MTISAWLINATKALKNIGIPSARLDSEIILAHTLRKPRTFLHAHLDETIDQRQYEIADSRLSLRLDRVPVAYIIGHKEFYGRNFIVSPSTLIPRPESESLIELLLNYTASEITPKNLVDVGTGSGALGITAKLERPNLRVTLCDIDNHALAIASKNADRLNAEVTLMRSDLLRNYVLPCDYIIANLPYVNPDWERSPETNHEPEIALFAAENGLGLIKKLIPQASASLSTNGKLLLEADPEQHNTIRGLAEKSGLKYIETDWYAISFVKL